LFEEPSGERPTQLLAAWFATTGAGFVFLPRATGGPYFYEEVLT
jgi:hypothetical protein